MREARGTGEEGTLLEIRNLAVSFPGPEGPVRAVREVSLSLAPGERLAIVGESGSGKSVTWLAALRLLPAKGRRGAREPWKGRPGGVSRREIAHGRL